MPASTNARQSWLISVDDHVIEPPNVWADRLPARYRETGPHMVEVDGMEVWRYEDKQVPTAGLAATAGKAKDEFNPDPIGFRDMRAGCYDPIERVKDMNRAGILASLCFPSFPRFCGQIFWEGKDRDLAQLCVEAYNDWMIDEWCGSAPGRYIPLMILPLWDPVAAAREIERCAAKGARGVAFSENPEPLGLPTVFDPKRYWDPVFAAAESCELVVCMHIGSSSRIPKISSDAPYIANSAWGANRTAGTMLAWLFSGTFQRFPRLKIALSEGQIGWIPYFLERAEQILNKQRHWMKAGYQHEGHVGLDPELDLDALDVRALYRDHVFGCFIDDSFGLKNLDDIGEDNVMIETDYPHSDSTWPDCIDLANAMVAHLPAATQYKLLRGNAERIFRFQPAAHP
jgi:predicted TIM-barrel fold metal-dependent hydrolase